MSGPSETNRARASNQSVGLSSSSFGQRARYLASLLFLGSCASISAQGNGQQDSLNRDSAPAAPICSPDLTNNTQHSKSEPELEQPEVAPLHRARLLFDAIRPIVETPNEGRIEDWIKPPATIEREWLQLYLHGLERSAAASANQDIYAVGLIQFIKAQIDVPRAYTYACRESDCQYPRWRLVSSPEMLLEEAMAIVRKEGIQSAVNEAAKAIEGRLLIPDGDVYADRRAQIARRIGIDPYLSEAEKDAYEHANIDSFIHNLDSALELLDSAQKHRPDDKERILGILKAWKEAAQRLRDTGSAKLPAS